MDMIVKGIYTHRGNTITKSRFGKGWDVNGELEIFKTAEDAKQYINKTLDSTNTTEPRIIGQVLLDENDKLIAKYYWRRKPSLFLLAMQSFAHAINRRCILFIFQNITKRYKSTLSPDVMYQMEWILTAYFMYNCMFEKDV